MEMTLNSDFVRELRGKANWSQEDLAAASGLSLRTIQRVESDGKAGLETQKALAAAFGVTPKDLNFDGFAYQPREVAIGTGLLLVWIGIAWYLGLGLAVGLIGVGTIYLLGQLARAAVHKLPALWEFVATGLVCLLAGIGSLAGLEIRLGAIVLVAIGCGLILKSLRA